MIKKELHHFSLVLNIQFFLIRLFTLNSFHFHLCRFLALGPLRTKYFIINHIIILSIWTTSKEYSNLRKYIHEGHFKWLLPIFSTPFIFICYLKI